MRFSLFASLFVCVFVCLLCVRVCVCVCTCVCDCTSVCVRGARVHVRVCVCAAQLCCCVRDTVCVDVRMNPPRSAGGTAAKAFAGGTYTLKVSYFGVTVLSESGDICKCVRSHRVAAAALECARSRVRSKHNLTPLLPPSAVAAMTISRSRALLCPENLSGTARSRFLRTSPRARTTYRCERAVVALVCACLCLCVCVCARLRVMCGHAFCALYLLGCRRVLSPLFNLAHGARRCARGAGAGEL
jgi:hypothetical protein